MKHRGSFTHRMDVDNRHNGQKQTNERTNEPPCPPVRPSLKWSLTLTIVAS